MSEVVKTWFEVWAVQNVTHRSLRIKKGDRISLGWTDGYPACCSETWAPHRFEKIPDAASLSKWSGMPWFYTFDISSIEVFSVTERVVTERERIVLEPLDA